jgi:hypothetical protein
VIPVVQARHVPDEIRGLAAPHDYVDLFVADATAGAATAEQLARAAINGASPVGRFLAWRLVCGLRLPPSPKRIAGWQIAARGDDWIRLAAASPYLSAQMVFMVEPERMSFATFVRYDRAIGRVIWSAASAIHRAAAPGFLRGGVDRIRDQAPAA